MNFVTFCSKCGRQMDTEAFNEMGATVVVLYDDPAADPRDIENREIFALCEECRKKLVHWLNGEVET